MLNFHPMSASLKLLDFLLGPVPKQPVAEPSPWRKPAKYVLFLDFDGVVSPGHSESFRHLPDLEALLRDFPFVDVVISSNWRERADPEYLLSLFAEDIAPRIAGVTPILTGLHARAREIDAYCREWQVDHRLVLDDSADLFPSDYPGLMLIPRITGMRPEHFASVRSILADWASAQPLPVL